MITAPDFKKKQIVFVFCNDGEKLQIRNDNLIVTSSEGKVKLQITCYRLFIVNIIGNCSLTSVLIQKSKKHGFYIAMYSSGFHLYQIIGDGKEANTMLKEKQYRYSDIYIAQYIVKNKIAAQYEALLEKRNKSEQMHADLDKIKKYFYNVDFTLDLKQLLAYEGLAAKLYFKNCFDNIEWKGRKPRIKTDVVNASLDIGYTLLFSMVGSILSAFGFDTYVGFYHRQFYMRKSLTCDIMEPFRPIVDKAVRKAINLRQIKEDDFEIINSQYRLKWKESPRYVQFLLNPIIERKDLIFSYIQSFYRSFMKDKAAIDFPFVIEGDIRNDSYKL